MASYNELNALIDAYINRNGVQAITGQILNGVLKAMVEQLGRGYTIMGAAIPTTDPGTPDGPECYFASTPGTYTDFNGLQVAPGELALLCYTPSDGWTKATIYEGFREVGATIDGNVGTPSVGVSYAGGVLSFDFHDMKGNPGQNGQDGAAAGFGTIGADITGGVGTPGVTVESSGPATAKNLQFHFTNLKGETGVTSVVATVDNTTGTPACTVSLVGQQLTLAFSGLKGAQGDTGVSADYPIAIVNNLTTNDPASALSAAQGVVLDGKVSQLEAKVSNIINLGEWNVGSIAPSSTSIPDYASTTRLRMVTQKTIGKSGNYTIKCNTGYLFLIYVAGKITTATWTNNRVVSLEAGDVYRIAIKTDPDTDFSGYTQADVDAAVTASGIMMYSDVIVQDLKEDVDSFGATIGDILLAGTLIAGETSNIVQEVAMKSGTKIYVTTTLGSGLAVNGMTLYDDAGNILTSSLKTANNLEITLSRDTTLLRAYAYGGHITASGGVSISVHTGFAHKLDVVNATILTLATKEGLMKESIMHLALNDGQYIDATGAVQSSQTFGYYSVPVCGGAKVRLFSCVSGSDNSACAAFYDENGNLTSENPIIAISNFANQEINISVPSNAVLMKISYRVSLKLGLYTHIDLSSAIRATNILLDNTISDVFEVVEPLNLSNLSFYAHSVASTSLTEDISDTQIKITRTGTKGNDQVKVSMNGLVPGTEYRIKCDASAFVNDQSYIKVVDGNTQNTLLNCTIVDGKINGTFIPTSTVPQIWIYLRYAEGYVVTFDNIMITVASEVSETIFNRTRIKELDGGIFKNEYASANNIFDGADPTTYGGEEMRVFKKGVCIGDSLTKGVFNYNSAQGPDNAIVDTSRSYPQFLAKMLGITIDNVATGGATTKNWWDEYGAGDYSGNDFAIIHLGLNDVLKNGSWNSESQTALTNIINKLKSDCTGIKIFVCTIFPLTAYLNAGESASPLIAAFVENLNDADVILVDMFKYSHAGDSPAYNNYHATALGYWKIANELKNYIGFLIHNNPVNFRAVQFIGTNYVL